VTASAATWTLFPSVPHPTVSAMSENW
jgi:hypothetical protein